MWLDRVCVHVVGIQTEKQFDLLVMELVSCKVNNYTRHQRMNVENELKQFEADNLLLANFPRTPKKMKRLSCIPY